MTEKGASHSPAPGTRQADLAAGALLGRYVVLELVGRGRSAEVYAAYDPELDRRVAAKVFRDEASLEGEAQRARAMARLQDPYLVGVHDAGTAEGRVFVAMEFVDGETLPAWLAREPRTAYEVLRVLVHAARGLAAAHDAGFVHGDFQATSVLVGRDGRAKVKGVREVSGQAPGEGATPKDALEDQRRFGLVLEQAFFGADAPRATPPWLAARVRKVLARVTAENPSRRFPSMRSLLTERALARRRFDPRWLALGGFVLVAFVVVIFVRVRASRAELLCSGSAPKLVGVWDDARRDAASVAFMATGKPYAADAWKRAEHALDVYTAAWVARRGEVCRATRLTHEQSEATLDLRMACLDDRLGEVRTLVDVFAHADGTVVGHAAGASESLVPLTTCDDVAALASHEPLRAGGPASEVTDGAREHLARAKVLQAAGKYKDARAEAERAVALADEAKSTALLARGRSRLGQIRTELGEFDGAVKELSEAAALADLAADDRTRAEAWEYLLFVRGYRQGRLDLTPLLYSQAMAALERMGGDDGLHARILNAYAVALGAGGRLDESARALEESIGLYEKADGKDSRALDSPLTNLGITYAYQGRLDEALVLLRRSLVIGERALGERHPAVAIDHGNVGFVLMMKLDLAGARQELERAILVGSESLGAEHPAVGGCLDELGEVLLESGDAAGGLATYQRAAAVFAKLPGQPGVVTSMRGVGEAYLALHDTKHAHDLLEKALELETGGERATDRAKGKLDVALLLLAEHKDPARARTLLDEAASDFEKLGKSPLEARTLTRIRATRAALR